MNKWIHFGFILLAALLCLLCSQPTQVQYGTLIVGIRWDTIADSSLSTASAQAKTNRIGRQPSPAMAQTKPMRSPDSVPFSKIKFKLQPGDLVFDFNSMEETYTLQAELGIYNLTVEVINSEGAIAYSTFYHDILIEPNKIIEIQLALEIHFSMAAPQFIDRTPLNTNTTGTYTLTWNSISGTETYILNEDEDSTFASPGIPYSGQDTTFTVSNKQDGIYYYRVRASSAIGKSPWSAAMAFQVILTPTLTITTDSLANGAAGAFYSTSVSATGGTTPYTWSVSAATLPGGLTINASTGAISGTPTTAGTFNFTVQVVDAGTPPQTNTRALSITINAPTLQIATTSLAAGQVGQAYNQSVSATGGTTPYTWSVSAATLPGGLTINASTGAISGTPAAAGTYNFTVQVADAGTPPQTDTQALSITINASALQITTTSLPDITSGTPYSKQLQASGGTPPYSWSEISRSPYPGFAEGIGLDANGLFSGDTYVDPGDGAIQVRVTDSAVPPATSTQTFSWSIKAGELELLTAYLPEGEAGESYWGYISYRLGTSPLQSPWTISGDLPDGIVLGYEASNYQLTFSGVPAESGVFNFTVTIYDSSVPQKTRSDAYAITINPSALAITTASLPEGQVGQNYNQTVTATGGMTPYTWSVSAGTLPDGLNINASTGAISGTPSAAGTFPFTVQVADAGAPQQSDTRALSITISVASLLITTNSLPNITPGVDYGVYFQASGGIPPYSWTEISRTPDGFGEGIFLDENGYFNGATYVDPGSGEISVSVTDSNNPQQTTDKTLSLRIVAADLEQFDIYLPDGKVAEEYWGTINYRLGTPPLQSPWTISGSLPDGLYLSYEASNYQLCFSGPPLNAGTYHFTVTVYDSSSPQKSRTDSYSITIHP